jgi:hypothetical protein
MEDEKLWNDSVERVLFLRSVGLDPGGSVATRLAGVRALIRRLQIYEAEIERDARSGDFTLAVDGEPVRAVIGTDGDVLLVHNGGRDHG